MSSNPRLLSPPDSLFFGPIKGINSQEFCNEEEVPSSWHTRQGDFWTYYSPDDRKLDAQGWKIHISAVPATLRACIDTACRLCFNRNIPFKTIRSPFIYELQNDKAGDRSESGKCITIYPHLDEFDELLNTLESELGGLPGPYILSDIRWGKGPLYVRYGGFISMERRNPVSNSMEYCIKDPSGNLIKDERGFSPHIPSWAPKPESINKVIQSSKEQKSTIPWNIERAITISNSGGIYLAHPKAGKTDLPQSFIVKEARPYTATDDKEQDSVIRLHHEYTMLVKFSRARICPKPYQFTRVWEHSYIVMENLEGETLRNYSVFKNPLLILDHTESDIHEYSKTLRKIFIQILEILRTVHKEGYVFGDLNPDNIFIEPDLNVRLIDWETAAPLNDKLSKMGKPGFVAPDTISGYQRDVWSSAVSILNSIEPYAQVLRYNSQKVGTWLEELSNDPAWAELAKMIQNVLCLGSSNDEACQKRFQSKDLIDGIFAAKNELDRFPGDYKQFDKNGKISLLYGATGIAAALSFYNTNIANQILTEARAYSPCEKSSHRTVQEYGVFTGISGLRLWEMRLSGLDPQKVEVEVSNLLTSLSINETVDDMGWDLENGASGLALLEIEQSLRQQRHSSPLAEHLLVTCVQHVYEAASSPRCPIGLLNGPAGVAYVCYRMWVLTDNTEWLDHANKLLNVDINRMEDTPNGFLVPIDGKSKKLIIPYLGSGSVGVGCVAHVLEHENKENKYQSLLKKISDTTTCSTIIYPGLMNGRAGLAMYLGTIAVQHKFVGATKYQQLLEKTWIHQVQYNDGTLLLGDGLTYLSADLATGNAGLLMAEGLAKERVFDPIGYILGLTDSQTVKLNE